MHPSVATFNQESTRRTWAAHTAQQLSSTAPAQHTHRMAYSYGGHGDAAMANTGAARADYHKNRNHNYASAAKSLLYGGDDKPATPNQHGKRSVPHAGQHGAAPFAQWDGAQLGLQDAAVQGGQVTKSYTQRNAKKEGAGKISSTDHGADAYKAQLLANASNLAAQKQKARGSAGLLGQHPATPALTQHHPDGPYEGGELEEHQHHRQHLDEPLPEPDHLYRY